MMPAITLIAAHRLASRHRDELARSVVAGCFHCGGSYPSAAIEDWLDNGDTAQCPHCGIDSVIGDASGLPVADSAFLAAMHRHWFGRPVVETSAGWVS